MEFSKIYNKVLRVLRFCVLDLSLCKTLRFNFHYLKFSDAIHFPILVSRHVKIKSLQGSVSVDTLKMASIRLGFDSIPIFDNVKSRSIWHVAKGASIRFKGDAYLGQGFKISANTGSELIFGVNFRLTAETTIICNRAIEFGNNVLLSWEMLIMDSDFHNIYDRDNRILNPPKSIEIGDNVWCGCRTMILKGAHIPDGSVIAAGSIVTTKLNIPDAIYAGMPIESKKEDIHWKFK